MSGEKQSHLFNCEKRHPKVCKFFREYHRCKFTTFCRYSHTVTDNDEQIKEIEIKMDEIDKKVETKIEAIKKKFEDTLINLENEQKEKDILINTKDTRICKLEKRMEIIEKTLEDNDKLVGKKDSKIAQFEIKIKQFEIKFSELNVKTLEKSVKKIDTLFECENCEFKTISKQGLKTQIKRKRTTYETFPIKCAL